MTELETQTWKIHQESMRISPALLQRKLKVTFQTAEQLCDWAYVKQAREAFQERMRDNQFRRP